MSWHWGSGSNDVDICENGRDVVLVGKLNAVEDVPREMKLDDCPLLESCRDLPERHGLESDVEFERFETISLTPFESVLVIDNDLGFLFCLDERLQELILR